MLKFTSISWLTSDENNQSVCVRVCWYSTKTCL